MKQTNQNKDNMTDENENTGAASGLTTAAGYRLCPEVVAIEEDMQRKLDKNERKPCEFMMSKVLTLGRGNIVVLIGFVPESPIKTDQI